MDKTQITRITYKNEGVTYGAVERGHLSRDQVIMALLRRKIGKHALVKFEHSER